MKTFLPWKSYSRCVQIEYKRIQSIICSLVVSNIGRCKGAPAVLWYVLQHSSGTRGAGSLLVIAVFTFRY